jgi:hypothetical protein
MPQEHPPRETAFVPTTDQLTDSLCDSESEDPWLIDFREGKVGVSIDHATKHFSDEYDKLYNPAPPELGRPCASDPIDPPMSGKEAKLVFEVMANVTVYLICGATRLGNVVGRETQSRVVRYLRQTASALRKGLELDGLEQQRLKRIKGLHEPDPEVVRNRADCFKTQQQLETFE